MRTILLIFLLGVCGSGFSQSELGGGEQPQLSQDTNGTIRLIYGQGDKIFYSVSRDQGFSFSTPSLLAEVNEMHLGMTRGPQLASSKDYSIATAMDKKGNIHSFRLDHKTEKWNAIADVNDIEGSAPEGLMSITADDANHFYAVWLDLREDKNNKIAFSTLTGNGLWAKNRIVYKSPDKTVCECCKPSVAVRGKNVSLMFRNWIDGSRDLHVITSADGGLTFGNAAKLGNGTWKLKGCPMDGGGLLIDKDNTIHTVWQREGVVYYDQPTQPENKISDGRSCNLFGKETPFITWQHEGKIYGRLLNGKTINIGEGSATTAVELNNEVFLAVWEKDNKVLFRRLE